MNIYISNLSYDTTSESLEDLFAGYGEVSSANIVKDRDTGMSRGFGFVEMINDDEGNKAIEELNNSDFEGKTLTVNIARPRNDRGNDRHRGGGNRRSY
ncbi:MAG: RNA-binding protein [Marinilabiliales bacterium]|nr:MAG: RNA-binding protein [Marinilabiliales bacterium]